MPDFDFVRATGNLPMYNYNHEIFFRRMDGMGAPMI